MYKNGVVSLWHQLSSLVVVFIASKTMLAVVLSEIDICDWWGIHWRDSSGISRR